MRQATKYSKTLYYPLEYRDTILYNEEKYPNLMPFMARTKSNVYADLRYELEKGLGAGET